MELGLNVFWLLLVVASLVWRPKTRLPGRGANRRTKGSMHGLFAMGCALAVLFPVISLTDNLHGEQAALEDSSSRTLKKWSGTRTSSNLITSAASPACLAVPMYFSAVRCLGQAVSAVLNLLRPAGICSFDGRAPPA